MRAAVFGTVLVLAVVLVIVAVSVTHDNGASKDGRGFGMQPAPASVVDAISRVPSSAFAQAGSAAGSSGPYTGAISTLKLQPAISSGGRPLIDFTGSNWCPYCAATRWPFAVALARFGTFKGLRITASGRGTGADYPGTNTLTFYGATYTSRYISFLGTEQCSDVLASGTSSVAVLDCNGYEPLEDLPGTAAKLFYKYDFQPYQTTADQGGIPFIDFGNKYLENGAFMSPAILSGLSHLQIARSLGRPAAPPGEAILVGANYYSAIVCKLTHDKPGSVCNMRVVRQATAALKL
jgi:hypothetical protein